jgi:serine kinase of HPr protein (carbohydrate metabolism regulator)
LSLLNIHATALVLDDRGVLIAGPSGAGKTTLALTLIEQFALAGRFARLVADDRLLVQAHGSRLVVACPPPIAGLVEVHGAGPQPLRTLTAAVVDLAIRLVEPAEAARFPEPLTETIEGIALPRLDLQARNATASALAVTAWLTAPPFVRNRSHGV